MEGKVLEILHLSAGYGSRQVLADVSFSITAGKVTAVMGPSGCGKTTLIRCINRMHQMSEGAFVKGKILLRGKNVFDMPPAGLRRRVGMVFQRPNPFPTMNIYDNVIAGYILNGIRLSRQEKDRIVEESLQKAYLWEEVKDNLYKRGTFLSGGQQQRLCIARALAMKPEVILLDEPTSSLDPKATAMIEELITNLKKETTIILVTHNRTQAARVSDDTAFMYWGQLVEFSPTDKIFTSPRDKKTEEYLTGIFG